MPLIKVNSLTTMCNYDYTQVYQVLIVLEYSPVGVKFPLTITWLTLYTVKKENKNFQYFFV
jgi:hypothetical protein